MVWQPESTFGRGLRRAAAITFLAGLAYTTLFAVSDTLGSTPPDVCVTADDSPACHTATLNADRSGYEGYGEGIGLTILGASVLLAGGRIETKLIELAADGLAEDAEFLIHGSEE